MVSRSRQLYGDVAERLRSHGLELIPFLTVGCLVAGFWLTLSLPSIVQATGLRAEPARESSPAIGASFRPQVQLRGHGETPVPAPLPVAVR